MKKWIFAAILIFVLSFYAHAEYFEEVDGYLVSLDQLAALGDKAPAGMVDIILDKVNEDPKTVVSVVLPAIKAKDVEEKKLLVYLWILGLTKDPKITDDIIKVGKAAKEEVVKGAVDRALASIGSPGAGKYLLDRLSNAKDPAKRFTLLNLLGQMQYEPALKEMGGLLTNDQAKSWEPIVVFSKMGDKAVPFLIGKIEDNNNFVRLNVVTLLGNWLIVTEAVEPLKMRYLKENDPVIRAAILGSLEKIIGSPEDVGAFFTFACIKERNPRVLKYARETLANIGQTKDLLDTFRKGKEINSKVFDAEYKKLYDSAGVKGDYKVLAKTSTAVDEGKLKKLRERVLQRNSDGTLSDYQKINNIIILNRMLAPVVSKKK